MSPDPRPKEPHAQTLSPGHWLVIALAVGLASGFGELAFQGTRRFVLDHWVRLGPHALWMTPLAQGIIFALFGGAAALAWRLRPRPGTAAVILGGFAGVAVLPEVLAQPWIDQRAGLVVAAGVAVQAARWAVRRTSLVVRVARLALPVLAGLLVVAGVAVPTTMAWRERQSLDRLPDAGGLPSVLLIFLDTVRAASLSLHGYERPTTPFLERLADQAIRFDLAYAPSSWTLPSHASVFTGRWPHELSADWNSALDDRFPTLAEAFGQAGYATGAFLANYVYTNGETGLRRGFLRYQVYRVSPAEVVASSTIAQRLANAGWLRRAIRTQEVLNRKVASQVREEFLDWVDGLGSRPFFSVLNFFDAHVPYLPPTPYDTLFGDGRILLNPRTLFQHRSVWLALGDWQVMAKPELQKQVNAYDGVIRYLDSELEALVEALSRRGLLDRTILVITSDHGEGLGEGGQFMHGEAFTALTTHVPLLIRYPPKVPGYGAVAEAVSLRDLPATLVDLAGLPGAGPRFPGRSLALTFRSPPDSGAPVSPALSSFWSWGSGSNRAWSVVRGRWRFVEDPDGEERLYHLEGDPYETRDVLVSSKPEDRVRADSLRALLDSVRAATTVSPRPHPSKARRAAPDPQP